MTCPASFAEQDLSAALELNLAAVRRAIERTGRDPDSVRILAVTKGFGIPAARAALQAGLTHLGENYASELATTRAAVPGATWHFLGNIQTNKLRVIAANAQVIESISRAREIDKLAQLPTPPICMIEVRTVDDPARGGAAATDVSGLLQRARDAGLSVSGLMTVASLSDPVRDFAAVRALADELDLPECSMGMSDDYETALQHGATEIRLGRTLFGPRR